MPLEKQPYLNVIAPIKKWLVPFCSSHDSASDDVIIGYCFKKMAAWMVKVEIAF